MIHTIPTDWKRTRELALAKDFCVGTAFSEADWSNPVFFSDQQFDRVLWRNCQLFFVEDCLVASGRLGPDWRVASSPIERLLEFMSRGDRFMTPDSDRDEVLGLILSDPEWGER